MEGKGKDHPCVSENGAKQASCAFVKSVQKNAGNTREHHGTPIV